MLRRRCHPAFGCEQNAFNVAEHPCHNTWNLLILSAGRVLSTDRVDKPTCYGLRNRCRRYNEFYHGQSGRLAS